MSELYLPKIMNSLLDHMDLSLNIAKIKHFRNHKGSFAKAFDLLSSLPATRCTYTNTYAAEIVFMMDKISNFSYAGKLPVVIQVKNY